MCIFSDAINSALVGFQGFENPLHESKLDVNDLITATFFISVNRHESAFDVGYDGPRGNRSTTVSGLVKLMKYYDNNAHGDSSLMVMSIMERLRGKHRASFDSPVSDI